MKLSRVSILILLVISLSVLNSSCEEPEPEPEPLDSMTLEMPEIGEVTGYEGQGIEVNFSVIVDYGDLTNGDIPVTDEEYSLSFNLTSDNREIVIDPKEHETTDLSIIEGSISGSGMLYELFDNEDFEYEGEFIKLGRDEFSNYPDPEVKTFRAIYYCNAEGDSSIKITVKLKCKYITRTVQITPLIHCLSNQSNNTNNTSNLNNSNNNPGFEPIAAYLVDEYDSKIAGASIVSATDGALTEIDGSPFSIEAKNGVATPDNKFLYSFNIGVPGIVGLSINPATGGLTVLDTSPTAITASEGGRNIAASPDGKYLYPTGFGGLGALSINNDTGELTTVPNSPYQAGTSENLGLAVASADGKFVYVYGVDTDEIYGFNVDPDTGELTPFEQTALSMDNIIRGIIITPDSKFLYVVRYEGLYGFAIDSTTGALTLLTGSPFVGEIYSGFYVAMHPSGEYLFSSSGGISIWAIDTITGEVTDTGNSVPSTNALASMSPSGSLLFAYRAEWEGDDILEIWGFDATNATLTQVEGSPFVTPDVFDGHLVTVALTP